MFSFGLISLLISLNLILIFFLQILAEESTTRVKSSYEYDFQTSAKTSKKRPEFTGRLDQDAWDLHNEYKDSIYVDRYYNSSFALNIPLFTVTLPGRGRGVQSTNSISSFNMGYSIMVSGLILLGLALYAPIIFPESRRSLERAIDIKSVNNFMAQQMDDFSQHVFGRKLKLEERESAAKTLEKQLALISTNIIHSMHESIEDLPHFPGKRFQECVKWCICETHKRPEKYGYLGQLFRSIFPHKSTTDSNNSKVLSHYRFPAKHGRDDTVDCADKYDDCSISIIEVVQEFNILANTGFDPKSKTKSNDSNFIIKLIEYYFGV